MEHLKSLLESELPSKPHQIALSMDEMKIKNGLVFNKHTGTLTGFVDLGTANEDIERLHLKNLRSENWLIMHSSSWQELCSSQVSQFLLLTISAQIYQV